MRLIRDLSLTLLLCFGLKAAAQERQPLDTDPNLLLRSAGPHAGDVNPKDLNPEHYKLHGQWREMTSDDEEDIPPGTNLATDTNGELTQENQSDSN